MPNYEIEIAPEAWQQLRDLTASQRATILEALESQLAFSPARETRNRKPMRPNPIAPWELRIGNLRVYYDIEGNPQPMVRVTAIGIKVRNQVFIGGKLWEL